MAITDIDEKLLVRAYQAGDERAFDTIVRTQWKALFSHAVRRLNDPSAAEDAVQDTLLRAYRALPNLDGDLALRAWLHRILTNVCYDEGNRRRRAAMLQDKVQALPEELAPDPVDEAVLHDTVQVMAEALQDLPDTYREALVLRYVDGLSFREVAEVAGITEENARARVHRGRQMLRKVMSRVAIVLAFLIPGMRRAQQAPAETAAPDPGISLVTQLTAHAAQAAPTVSRFAEVAAATSGSKSALVTGAVAAAAAITVPVAAYTVHEASRPEVNRKPAAVAAPFPERTSTGTAASGAEAGESTAMAATQQSTSTTATSTTSTTVTTLPPSAAAPFAPIDEEREAEPESSDTSTPPSTTPAPKEEQPPAEEEPTPQVAFSIGGDQLTVTGEGPNLDLAGDVRVGGRTGTLGGRLTLHDDDAMAAELTLTIDGTAYHLRLRGIVTERSEAGDAWAFSGKFSLPRGAELDLPEAGDLVSGRLQRTGDVASLILDLQGPDPDAQEG